MLGQKNMAWVDKRLRQATGKLAEPFGGLSLILIGDFGQLPPVGDRPIYAPAPGSVLGDQGHTIYKLFDTVVLEDRPHCLPVPASLMSLQGMPSNPVALFVSSYISIFKTLFALHNLS